MDDQKESVGIAIEGLNTALETQLNDDVLEPEDGHLERIEVAYGYTQEELDAPIFPGGPTRLEVEQWKEKYKGVYFTPFDDDVFVWRTLERPEYKTIISDRTLTQLDREEIFTEKCVLYPRNYTREKMRNDKAGIPSLLSEMIMDKSGFVSQSAPIKL